MIARPIAVLLVDDVLGIRERVAYSQSAQDFPLLDMRPDRAQALLQFLGPGGIVKK
jgi:hypothetical protein